MSNTRKYAGLPDLDFAADIYETPELTDDASTRPTSTVLRSESQASSYKDAEDGVTGIDRHRLDPDEARTHFLPSRVDAREANFSDRIDTKRKSYHTASQRKWRGDSPQEFDDSTDGEEVISESLRRKIARLHRETEELKFEIGKLRENSSGGNNASIEDITDDSLNQLSSAIEVLDGVGFGGQQSAERRLAQKLSSITKFTSSDSNGTTSHATTGKAERTQDGSSYTVSYVPSFQQNHILAKAADFDKRLVLLEEVLGLDNMLLPSQGTSSVKAVLPTLDTLDRQVAFLTSTSASSLDPIGKRIRQLTQEAEKLDEARRSAKASQEALKSSQSETFTHPDRANDTRKGDDGDDTEDISKINSLYGILPSIESLAPLLPSVLDRLRSLRLIHADAAGASHTLANVEKRQAEMVADIKSWRAGLEKVEGVMRDSEVTMASNMKMIEGWVQELEGRVKSLG